MMIVTATMRMETIVMHTVTELIATVINGLFMVSHNKMNTFLFPITLPNVIFCSNGIIERSIVVGQK